MFFSKEREGCLSLNLLKREKIKIIILKTPLCMSIYMYGTFSEPHIYIYTHSRTLTHNIYEI